jgi:type III secretion protein U
VKEKTHKPTPKKLRDARKKGQVAKSKEIATCCTFIVLILYLWIFSNHYLTHIGQIIITPNAYFEDEFLWSYIALTKKIVKEMIILSVPFAIIASIATIISYMLQFGLFFAAEAIKPDFKRISPFEGFKKLFSWSNLLELFKSIIKIGAIGSILFFVLRLKITQLINLPEYGVKAIFPTLLDILGELLFYILCVFVFFAIIDYFLQNQIFLRKLRMSTDDLRQEHKDREGEPQVKNQRRQIQRSYVTGMDMISQIKRSTLIITDFRKIAISIYYKHGETKLPIIQVKGKYLLAERIIDTAEKFRIPVIQDTNLANKIFDTGGENSYISGEVIEPMARLLRSELNQ